MGGGNESGNSENPLVSEVKNLPFFKELEEYKQFFEGFYARFQAAVSDALADAREYTDMKMEAFGQMNSQLVEQLGKEGDEKVGGLRTEMRDFFEKDLIKRVESMFVDFGKGELSDRLKEQMADLRQERTNSFNAYDKRLMGERLPVLFKSAGDEYGRKLEKVREEGEKTLAELRGEVAGYKATMDKLGEDSASKSDFESAEQRATELSNKIEKLGKQVEGIPRGLTEEQVEEMIANYVNTVQPSPEKSGLKIGDESEGAATVVLGSASVEETKPEKSGKGVLADALREADESHDKRNGKEKKKD